MKRFISSLISLVAAVLVMLGGVIGTSTSGGPSRQSVVDHRDEHI